MLKVAQVEQNDHAEGKLLVLDLSVELLVGKLFGLPIENIQVVSILF